MPELTVKEIEVVRDIPGNPPAKGGPAKILKVSFEGDERQPEMFATARTNVPSVGSKVDDSRLTFNKQWDRWEFAKQDGGGFKKSPEQEKRIVRQHSQEMACRVMAVMGRVLSEEEFTNLVGWFEADAYGRQKQGVVSWPMTSDVPMDTEGL